MNRQPLAGPQCDVLIGLETVLRLNDVNILNPETVTGAQAGAGVVGVMYVFQDERQSPRALRKNVVEPLQPLSGHKLLQEFKKSIRHDPGLQRCGGRYDVGAGRSGSCGSGSFTVFFVHAA